MSAENDVHNLDTTARPPAWSCGRAKFAGSPSFVRSRHAAHVEEVTRPIPPGGSTHPDYREEWRP